MTLAPASPDHASPATAPGLPTGRLDGVDVARAIALVGMVTVHFGPGREVGTGATAFVYHAFYGKASILFALVAGVGVGLMASRRPAGLVRVRMLYRALWLVPLGLALEELDHPVAVILQYYGLFFLGVVPFVGRRRATVLAGAAAWLLVGSGTVLAALVLRPEWMVRTGGDPPTTAWELLVGGYYPAVAWVPVLLFGMWLATVDLRSPRVRTAMVVGGAATLAATRWASVTAASVLDLQVERGTWAWALAESGHSEMPLAILGAVGFGTAVLGASLVVVDVARPVVAPLAALGRLALTVYVGHLLVYAWVPDLFPADTVAEGVAHVGWFALATAVGSWLWLLAFPRGPLEAAVRWPFERLVVPLDRWARGAPRP